MLFGEGGFGELAFGEGGGDDGSIAAAVATTSSVAAALTTSIRLAASLLTASSASASLTLQTPIAASVTTSSSVTAELATTGITPRRRPLPRLEIWTDLECAGGERVCFLRDVSASNAVHSIDGPESLRFSVPLTEPSIAEIRQGRVARVRFWDDAFDEWPIGLVTTTHDFGGRIDVACVPVIDRLQNCGLVEDQTAENTTGLPVLDSGAIDLTPTEYIQNYLIDNPGAPPFCANLSIGTIDPDDEVDYEWSEASPRAFLGGLAAVVQSRGEPCEQRLTRNASASYDINLLHEIGASAPVASIRWGRNELSLTRTDDPTDRVTRMMAKTAPLGGVPTYLGAARWLVTDVDGTDVTLEDPAGGAGPIAFDNQTVGWFLLREKTGGTFEITDAVAGPPCVVTLASASTLAIGEYVEFRTSASESDGKPIGPSPNPGAAIGTAIHPLQVTAIAGSVFTVENPSFAPSLQRDGQYADAHATFAKFIAAPVVIGSTEDALATHTIELDSVTGIAVDDLAYECLSVGAPYPFNAAKKLRITAIDGMALTVDVELYDTPGVPFVRQTSAGQLLVTRPQDGSAVVTNSDVGDLTVTLDLDTDAESWDVDDGTGLLFLRIVTGQGTAPYYLDHPAYIDDIDIRFGTIDRGDIQSVANLSPNALMRQWADPDEPPDGWSTRSNGVGNVTIAKNTDPLYTQLGGASLYFKLTQGGLAEGFAGYNAIVSPPIPWTAVREGERFSVRLSMLLVNWTGEIALEAKLGVMLPDGTVKTWEWPDATEVLIPTNAKIPLATIKSSITKAAGDTWLGVVLNGFDITSEGASQRVSAGDIANAVGYVVVVTQAKGTVEGYLDAVMVTPSAEAPAAITEFGDANRTWQTTNMVLSVLAPPQKVYAGEIIDLQRLNPNLSIDQFVLGGTVLVNDIAIGERNVSQRCVEIEWDYKRPGRTKVTLASRARRLTELIKFPRTFKERPDTPRVGGGVRGEATGFSWDDWYEFLHAWDVVTGDNTAGATRASTANAFPHEWSIPGAVTVTDDYSTVNGRSFQKFESIGTSAVYIRVNSHQDFPSIPQLNLGQQLRISVPVKAVAGVDGFFMFRVWASDEDGSHPNRYTAEARITVAAGVVTAAASIGTVLAVENRTNGEYRVLILTTIGNGPWPLNDEQEIILIDGPDYDGYASLFDSAFDPARQVSAIDAVLIGPVELFSYVPGATNQATAQPAPGPGSIAHVGDEKDAIVDWFDRDYWFDVAPTLRRNSPLGAWTSDNTGVVTIDATTGHMIAVGTGTAHISWEVTTASGTVTSNRLTITIT